MKKGKNLENEIDLPENIESELENLKAKLGETMPDVYEARRTALVGFEYFVKDYTKKFVAKSEMYKAIKIDPYCFDAYLGLIMIMDDNDYKIDPQTGQNLLRELLSLYGKYISEKFTKLPNVFSDEPLLAPYIRVLSHFTDLLMETDQLEIATYMSELLLRINFKPKVRTTFYILANYIKVIGRERSRQPVFVERNTTHLKALLEARDSNNNLIYDFDDPEWGAFPSLARVYLEYCNGAKNWRSQLRKFIKTFSQLAREVIVYITCGGELDVRHNCQCHLCTSKIMVEYAFMEDSPFNIVLHNEYQAAHHPIYSIRSIYMVPNVFAKFSRAIRKNGYEYVEKHLESGRQTMSEGNYQKSVNKFSKSMEILMNITYLEKKFYEGMQYAIITNRATSEFKLELLDICRHDIRLGLFQKKDCKRLYEYIHNIMVQFNAMTLVPVADELWEQAKSENPDFEKLSKKAIAILSLEGLIAARTDKLSEDLMNDLENRNIEDMFSRISFPSSQLDPLPWLNDQEQEEPVILIDIVQNENNLSDSDQQPENNENVNS